MNIPDSITQIMTEANSDPFRLQPTVEHKEIQKLIYNIRQYIGYEATTDFDKGVAYYKNTNNANSFITGIITLYIEALVQQIKDAEIENDLVTPIIDNFNDTTRQFVKIFDTQQKLLLSLKNTKNILDVEKLSYIILGYAIETIRKIQHHKAEQQ